MNTLGFVISTAGIFWRWFVCWKLWGWHAVALLGVAPITYWETAALCTVVGAFNPTGIASMSVLEKLYENDAGGLSLKRLEQSVFIWVVCAFSLLVGWLLV